MLFRLITLRALRAFASLRLAIVLLVMFTVCLSVATLLEARYSARIAQELVYRAWWFTLLLALLACNVLGAALKKFPWSRRQTGFLVTHCGLLVMLAGGLLTTLFGEEGEVVLIDAADPTLHSQLGMSNQAETMVLTGEHTIDVFCLKPAHSRSERQWFALWHALEAGNELPDDLRDCLAATWSLRFAPGCFPWRSDEHLALQLPWELSLLYALASPWPAFTVALDAQATLTVLNFYPDAVEDVHHRGRWTARHVDPGSDAAQRPALRCRLSRSGESQEFWVGLERGVAPIRLHHNLFLVRYRSTKRPMGFALTLRRASQIKDPGSERPAWFESEVTVTSRHDGHTESADERIYMNHPLSLGPYQLYQANYRALIDPATRLPVIADGRPVSVSGLAVARDPGLWLKYAGTLIVVQGIATMFYMRAYFFRPAANRS